MSRWVSKSIKYPIKQSSSRIAANVRHLYKIKPLDATNGHFECLVYCGAKRGALDQLNFNIFTCTPNLKGANCAIYDQIFHHSYFKKLLA